MTITNAAGHAGDVGARPVLENLLSAAIIGAFENRRDPTAAAVAAAHAFRAGLAEFAQMPPVQSTKLSSDSDFVLIPQTALQRADGSVLVVPAFWYARYPASKDADGAVMHSFTDKPWVNVKFNDAVRACSAAGLQLARESQELVVRHLICQQPENWTGGEVGVGQVYQGLHLGTVSSAQAADHVSPNANERSWHVLPGGERVYGVAGNIYTLALDDVQGDARGLVAGRLRADSISLTTAPFPSRDAGMGYRTAGDDDWSGGALVRGGYWGDGDVAGVFGLGCTYPDYASDYVGFRCTKPE